MTFLVNKLASLLRGGGSPGIWSEIPPGSGGDVFGPPAPGSPLPGGDKPDLWGKLSTGLTLASAGLSLFGANEQAKAELMNARAEARALTLQSEDMALEAQREETRGKQEANQITDSLLQTIAAQRASFAVNGVDIGFGSPQALRKNTQKLASLQLSTTRDDALARAISRRRQASALQEERGNVLKSGAATVRQSRLKGLVVAGGTLAELAQRRSERG